MKKYLVAAATLALLALGTGAAQAADGEQNGEETAIFITVPTAPNGCATVPGDITGTADVYTPYGDGSDLVATYSTVEDSDGFTVTATRQSQFYALIDPRNPVRVVGLKTITFLIPKCTTEPEPVTPAPVCQEDEPCFDCRTMGNHVCGTPEPAAAAAAVAPPAEPQTSATTYPAPAVQVQSVPVPEAPVAPVEAVQAPVQAEQVAATVPAKATELAFTGAKEDRMIAGTVIGSLLLLAGIGVVLLNRKLKTA